MRRKEKIFATFILLIVSLNQGFSGTVGYTFPEEEEISENFVPLEEKTRIISFSQLMGNEILDDIEVENFEFKVGEIIVFVAEPNPGYFFNYWEINGQKVSENSEFEFKMPDRDINVVGYFKKLSDPKIQIISPMNNAVYESNSSIPVRLEANSENGRITKVELFRNGNFLVSINDPSIIFNLNISQEGRSNLIAKVTDERGAVAFSPEVRIDIIPTNIPPEVKIISPGNGEEFLEGTDINLEAEALDSDGSISKVEFYSNGILIGSSKTAPFVFTLVKPSAGTYTITAKAFDNKGEIGNSQSINIVVRSILKISEVELLTPVPQQVYEADETILFSVIFIDGDENVKKVEYYSGSQLVGVSDSKPHSFQWENVLPGDYEVKAVAVGGYPEIRKESTSVKIQVKNIPFEIVTPSRNARLTAGTDLQIRVQIPISIKKIRSVEYFRGNQLIGSSTGNPYSFLWKSIPVGEHNLVARLIYEDNSTILSNVVKIFSDNNVIPRVNLSYEVINPENFEEYAKVRFEVDIKDLSSDVSEVEYFVDGNLIGFNTVDPFGFTWMDVKPGRYSAKVRLLTKNGMQINSSEVVVEVLDLFNLETDEVRRVDYVIGPNPTSDRLNIYFKNIEYAEDLNIHVYSMDGSLSKVFKTTIQESKVTLDLLDLGIGVYFLQLQSENYYLPSIRFIKK